MNWIKNNGMIALLALAVAVIAALVLMGNARAADLGGACCADLEERIAELEATVAKKGNRKVSLIVYGQVSKGVLFLDSGDESEQWVQENSSAESFVGFAGEGRISDAWKAGFILEIGVGGYDQYGEYYYSPSLGGDTNDVYTRNAAVWLSGPLGRTTLGHYSQATDGIAETTVVNTPVAARMLSLRPLVGPQFGEAADLFDGTRGDLVRYDSSVFGNFQASASWSSGVDEDSWDAALRYAGEFSGFRVAAGLGLREGLIVPGTGVYGVGGDLRVISGSASVKHIATGVFLNGAAGQFSPDGGSDLTAWHVQGGVEQNWTKLGNTTVFGEFAALVIDGTDASPTLWGIGLIQSFAANELGESVIDGFVNVRIIDPDTGGDDVTAGMIGGRMRF